MATRNDDHLKADETRMRILEVGHGVLTEQISELSVGLLELKQCLEHGNKRISAMEVELQTNSATTGEVREILQSARAGLRVLGMLGLAVRWMGYIAVAGVAVYTAIHMISNNGRPPGGP